LCFTYASLVAGCAQEKPRSNWTTADVPCAKYGDLRNTALEDIGVKIDAAQCWRDAFRQAFRFWNTVLAANFHSETDLSNCAVRVVSGGRGILKGAMVARSQFPERSNFRGKIVVSPAAVNEMNSAEMYGTAVHELGHMLGLKHNASSHSVMYFLDVNGTEGLDCADISDLSKHHKLRPAIYGSQLVNAESRFGDCMIWTEKASPGALRTLVSLSGIAGIEKR
jgi:hypothetical protein